MRRANPLKSCFRFGTRALSTVKSAATFTTHCGTLTRLSLPILGAAAWGFHVVAGRVAILQLTAAQLDPPGTRTSADFSYRCSWGVTHFFL
jgi:hypothetical protein